MRTRRARVLELTGAVGNIPYDISEEQLKNVFSEVGAVVEVRLVTERDTCLLYTSPSPRDRG